MSATVSFHGGPHDGEVHEVAGRADEVPLRVMFPVPPPVARWTFDTAPAPTAMALRVDEYELGRLADPCQWRGWRWAYRYVGRR